MEQSIVIVDDDARTLKVLTLLLEESGYKAIGASNHEEFMKVFPAARPHLVVCDIQLPTMNGIELLQWIKKTSPATPVIMVSAVATAETRKRVLQFGADDFFDKPVDLARFRGKVRELVEKGERARDMPYALVADDHAQTRDFLADLLIAQGWIVERAVDGEDAIRRARTSVKPFDVAFIDIVMPRLGGLAALHAIHVASPTTTLVAVTGEATSEEIKTARQYGVAAVILKPINQDDFLRLLPELARSADRLKKSAPRNGHD